MCYSRLIFVCCTLLALGGCGATSTSTVGHLLAPRSVDFDAPGVTIPLQMRDGRAFVEVMINDKGPYLFLVDTGCALSGIDSALARELSLPPSLPPIRSECEGRFSRPVRVRQLRLGEAVLCDHLLEKVSLPKEVLAADGILGMNAFAHCQVQLDFPNKQMHLLRQRLSQPADGKTVFAMAEPFRPTISAQFDDGDKATWSWPCLVDTGYDRSMDLPDTVNERTLAVTAAEGVTTRGLYGCYESTLMTYSGRIRIGRHEIAPVSIAVGKRGAGCEVEGNRGLLGMGILRHYVLSLDPRTKKMSILPPEPLADSLRFSP